MELVGLRLNTSELRQVQGSKLIGDVLEGVRELTRDTQAT
jgi:hypothetical protein